MRKGAATLKRWLVAQLMAMAVVGVLTGLGLWLADRLRRPGGAGSADRASSCPLPEVS